MENIYLRLAEDQDLDAIDEIINDGKQFLAKQKIDQWQAGFPEKETIISDIKHQIGYVLIYGDAVVGYAALNKEIDEDYEMITNGSWDNENQKYYSIHRFVISSKYRGHKLADKLFSCLLSNIYAENIFDVRIDTHPENKIMQSTILNNGFKEKGIIYISENNERKSRIAYQTILGK